MNSSATSATSAHPLSITRECPRSAISWISVVDWFSFWRLKEALAMAQRTVLSFWPEMNFIGPRLGSPQSTATTSPNRLVSPRASIML
jgi:hypothetical protein